jgi:cytochrome c-type biogenesis protein CcmH
MDQGAAKPVRLPPKAGATPLLTPLERDALERRLHCQCSCTLDVFTCRTTDFSCQVSPAMHRDVMGLVAGGYSGQEILDAFVGTYGQRALMAPSGSGFNLLAWFTPGVVLVAAGGALFVLLRRWGKLGEQRGEVRHVSPAVNATPDELARLEAAVKGDDSA